MASIFVSPGVYTQEQDFSTFASQIGITRLGLVGQTLKGPAFQAIKVKSTDEFLLRFGSTDPTLPLPYVANSFLGQSTELVISRILGKTGFQNSPAWLIVADYSTTYSGSIAETGMTLSVSDETSPLAFVFSTSANTSLANNTLIANTVGNNIYVGFSGSAVSTSAWLNAINTTAFSGLGITVAGASSSTFITSAGTSTFTLSANTVESKGAHSGSTLAILRSKKNQVSNTFYFSSEKQIQLGNITSTLGAFIVSASTGPLTAVTNSGYTVSLDETRDDYIMKILGNSPEIVDGHPNVYVERIYPHFIREASARGEIKNINLVPVYSTEAAYEDFTNGYSNAMTPWVVSRVIGGEVKDLFRFQTISDGDSANSEIKISIANIDIINYSFDVIVRRFGDTDATASQTALERWSNLNLNENDPNFIGKIIGTTDESFPQKSMFITVDMAQNHLVKTVPAGFRGYSVRGSGISGTTSAGVYYKTDYYSGDSKFKAYLGISELGYTSFTQNQVSVRNAIKSLEADYFAYDGVITSGMVATRGFHMENIADSTQFISGDKNSLTAYTNVAGTLIDKTLLKFTFAPVGGFDGWDKYKLYQNPFEQFTDAYQDNIQSFKDGIDILKSPETVDINVFATPGVDFENNLTVINYALDMVETRADSIYIIEAPRITVDTEKGTPEEVVSILESTGIDSNYAATYWPWVQVQDPNTGKYSYQSPTLMIVKALAFTDNVAAPWFAPAGINRGTASNSIIRADIRLSKDDRDVLYQGRVNPIATFIQQGVVIWGQKTLQVNSSALDRVNVRRLLLQVRRLVAAASLALVFEPNDPTLRDQFLAKVEPILLQIQNQRGLNAFKVIMDDSNNNAQTIDQNLLVGKIQLQPTRAAEFITLDFQVLPTGANFEDF